MKTTSGSVFGSIAVFVWCLFMGVTVGSIGIGAIFPPANLLAKPFVCPNGTMSYDQSTTNPRPGTTVTTTAWSCVDNQSGEITELGIFPMSLYAGLIYGLLLYVVVLMVQLLGRRGRAALPQTDPASLRQPIAAGGEFNQDRRPPYPAPSEGRADTVARMERLNELRTANMISESEYQQKREEILKEL